MPTNVIGYVRVSTEQQQDSGLSIEAQTAKLKMYCDMYDLHLVEVVTEIASAKSLNKRPKLEAIINRRDCGIIVAKLDRLTRSVGDLAVLLTAFPEGRHLISITERVDTTSANGRLMLNLLISVAQWEREAIAERTKDALAAKRSRGEPLGRAPFGFRWEAGEFVEDQADMAILRRILELRRQGATLQAIANTLNAENLFNRHGRPWNRQLLSIILLAQKSP